MVSAPASFENLRDAVLARYSELSGVLQRVARELIDDPNSFAVDTVAAIAARGGVPPSAVVRFAQAFGYGGASDLQKVIRSDLLAGRTGLSYRNRARDFAAAGGALSNAPRHILDEIIGSVTDRLHALAEANDDEALDRAVAMILESDQVFVAGFRRSFSVAAYLAYGLQQAGKRCVLVDGGGGMDLSLVRLLGAGDLLVAISYEPYASETIALAQAAMDRNSPVLAITDSSTSSIGRLASLALIVHDPDVRGFRSLAASFSVAQTLVMACAFASD